MSVVKMSELTFKELTSYLKNNNVTSNTLRIFLTGFSCSGPQFNLALDDKNIGDVTEKIGDTTFLVEGDLFKQFKGFEIKCPEENGLDAFTIEPFEQIEGMGCASCSGCDQ